MFRIFPTARRLYNYSFLPFTFPFHHRSFVLSIRLKLFLQRLNNYSPLLSHFFHHRPSVVPTRLKFFLQRSSNYTRHLNYSFPILYFSSFHFYFLPTFLLVPIHSKLFLQRLNNYSFSILCFPSFTFLLLSTFFLILIHLKLFLRLNNYFLLILFFSFFFCHHSSHFNSFKIHPTIE